MAVMLATSFASRAEATLILTPGGATCTNDATDASQEEALTEACAATVYDPDPNLSLYYKGENNGSEDGTFATSYSTTITDNTLDPTAQDVLIKYISGLSITCPICFLAIKDGAVANPNYYFFNIANWNGIEDILLQGFYPGEGGVSHVSIWGVTSGGSGSPSTLVPEPASLLMLGTGLTIVAAKVRNRKRKIQ